MRKRLKKKLLCPECGLRGIVRSRKTGAIIVCFPCERKMWKDTRQIICELSDRIPIFGAFKQSGIFDYPGIF